MAVLTVSKEVPEMGGTSGYGRRVWCGGVGVGVGVGMMGRWRWTKGGGGFDGCTFVEGFFFFLF